MPICKKTIEYRKINNLCQRCGQPNASGKSLCQKHLDQFASKALKYRHIKISKGLCPECGNPNKENQYCCDACKEKNKSKHQKYFQKRYSYIKENSLCQKCGEKTLNNKTTCEECSLKINKINKYKYENLLKNNLCVLCGKNQINDKTYCEECVQKRSQWYKKSNTRIKNKIERQEESKKVFDHYGKKCVFCGEDDLDVLSIDHINDDGYIHRKRVGSGSKFYKWILANNFPNDLQILCMNCQWKKHRNNGINPTQQKLTEEICIIDNRKIDETKVYGVD